MATSSDHDATLSLSSNESQPNSPTDTTHLMTHRVLQRNSSLRTDKSTFSSPWYKKRSLGRFPSPRIASHYRSGTPPRTPVLVRSVSENLPTTDHWKRPPLSSATNPRTSMGFSSPTMNIIHGESMNVERGRIDSSLHSPEIPVETSTHHTRNPSMTEIKTVVAPFRSSSIRSEIRVGGLLSRSSTRRSFGREWTRSHWEKVRDLEQESERARRCSKLSSGFAPLMVFGGLVFICIGVSATTNSGKDKERLQKLSAAPMAMGVFMLSLGVFLIVSWFGCRGRAKNLEQQLLHGSRRSSIDNNLVQNIISKLYATTGSNRRDNASPTLPGVTLDGVDVLKPLPDSELQREEHPHAQANEGGCCRQCGAANTSVQAVLETSI